MSKLEDYYKILQVHYNAEPEIIESAYKKLAKKYHPDINSNSTHATNIMQKINEAYQVLKDPQKREIYDEQFFALLDKVHDNKALSLSEELFLSQAQETITSYFENLSTNNMKESYRLITSKDKLNISYSEFLKWQKSVSKIFQLKEFSIISKKIYKNYSLAGQEYSEVIEFVIQTVENNSIMHRTEHDTVKKHLIFEDSCWKIFLGRTTLIPLIQKFEKLYKSSLSHNKSVLSSSTDPLSSLFTKITFLEKSSLEFERSLRYKKHFTLILFKITLSSNYPHNTWRDFRSLILKNISSVFKSNLRRIDISCRWSSKIFVVLLPETAIDKGKIVQNRILHQLNSTIISTQKAKISLLCTSSSMQNTNLNIYDSIKKLKSKLT
jgi:diguanylate cyclase (GGDEF)-like protein